jgi:hypothetical protein
MNNEASFPLSLDFEDKHFSGEVTPSDEKGPNGMPVYFRVTLGGALFAYLCCGDSGWKERDGKDQPRELVNEIGKYILDYYE